MAVNLVSLIMQFLTPDMIGRIASALGLDRTNTQTAIGAAIPGLLAGLSGVAAQPGGAQKLVDTLSPVRVHGRREHVIASGHCAARRYRERITQAIPSPWKPSSSKSSRRLSRLVR